MLRDNLRVWDDEEDSVKEEHAAMIAQTRGMVDWAESGRLDLYLVEHFWEGRDHDPYIYLVRCAHVPTEAEVVKVCEINLEDDVADQIAIAKYDIDRTPIVSTSCGVAYERPFIVICEVEGGVLQWTHESDPRIKCYTLDHDNIAAGGPDDHHGIPDEAFIACNLDPDNYRKDVEEDTEICPENPN